ncbi:MAG: NHLP family bacteriocin export ABC transporter peptidase/permease/ATPase subunit [Prevotella sp.]|nr:NHLP family bacteriocin export ABC transporter peptidase/permease/ATPase subunit [Prevotella sp.]
MVCRVPMVMQMEALECGAATVAMVLAYYGKWLPLEQVREACGVSRDGSSAHSLLKAARAYGMEANGYRVSVEALEEMQPAILHWNFNHFVVFRGFKGNHAYINDPALGPMELTMDDFRRSFTGVALELKPTNDFQPEGAPVSILSYVKKYLNGAREAFWLTFVFSLLAAFVAISVPLFTNIFFDEILSGHNRDWGATFITAMGAVALFAFVLEFLKDKYSLRIAGSLALKGNVGFLQHLLHLPMAFYSMRYVGDLQQRQHLNERITKSLVDVLAPQLINIALLVLYLILMVSYSLTLSLVGVLAALINLALIQWFARKRVNLIRTTEQSEGRYFSATVSCIDNMESIKAAGAETGFFSYWSGLWAQKFNRANDADDQEIRMGVVPILITGLVDAAVLILGAVFILKGELTIGMLMAFQGFMASFITPVSEVVGASQRIIEMRSQMERVDDVMRYSPTPDPSRTGEGSNYSQGEKKVKDSAEDVSTPLPPAGGARGGAGKLGGDVELRHVTFGYSKMQPPLIEDFSLHIEPGRSVAIVGSSGCGKSTLAKLITGLYKPWSGEVLFDGRNIESISSEEFTNSVAAIDQNIVLFDDTVAQNIRMWDHSIEDFTMMMACNDAQIRTDIVSRPEGFATRLVKGGQNFSGGQRQRMEIATALAKEPVVLIMDEATSALDPKTEDEVMQSVRMMGPTLIVVAHRLSTIRDCDEIIVMDQGRIVQRGTHDELLAQPGLYQDLMNSE